MRHQEGQNFVHSTRRYFGSGDNGKLSYVVLPTCRTIVPLHVSRNSSRAGKSHHLSQTPRIFSLNLAVRILTRGHVRKAPDSGWPACWLAGSDVQDSNYCLLQKRRLFAAIIRMPRTRRGRTPGPTQLENVPQATEPRFARSSANHPRRRRRHPRPRRRPLRRAHHDRVWPREDERRRNRRPAQRDPRLSVGTLAAMGQGGCRRAGGREADRLAFKLALSAWR